MTDDLVKIHYLSQVPIKLKLYFDNTYLYLGTAFVYKKKSKLYLVSNWHILSGRNSESGRPLSNTAGIPNRIKCKLVLNKPALGWDDYTFELLDENAEKMWLEHPIYASSVDIAVLPIEIPNKFKSNPINNYEFTNLRAEVAQDVFVIGFPRGINGRKELPIWKRASIASEPGGNFPRILIDTATREGMSGSPVIMQHKGFYINLNDDDDWRGDALQFLGVYSGRLGALNEKDEFKAQLGIVWKKDLIDEIIEQNSYD